MCLETLIVQKYYICFLSYDKTNFQINKRVLRVSESFEHVLENFKISKNLRHLSEKFQHVSGIFFKWRLIFLSYATQKVLNCYEFPAWVWNSFIVHKDNIFFLLYYTQNFQISQKFPDCNATLPPGFFVLCECDNLNC